MAILIYAESENGKYKKDSFEIASYAKVAADKLNTSVIPFILRGIKLWGIDSVTVSKKRREFIWSQVSKLIDFNILNKRIKEINLEQLILEYPNVLKGAIAGRLIVNPNI